MKTCHAALLLTVAMVLLSTGICVTRASAPAPRLGLEDKFPPKHHKHAPEPGPGLYSCSKILYSSGCHAETCLDKCFSKLKGDGLCIHKACKCSFKCKQPRLAI